MGPLRRFEELTTAQVVEHGVWVRSLPVPFDGSVEHCWLQKALAANHCDTPDVLAIAMQYTRGASALYDVTSRFRCR